MGLGIASKGGAVLFFFVICYHLFPSQIQVAPNIIPVYLADPENQAHISGTKSLSAEPYNYHIPMNGTYANSKRFRVLRLGPSGETLLDKEIPQGAHFAAEKETASLANTEGYLTYPENGSFYIWYPKLGGHVLFYDSEGNFLWNKKNSHYLLSSPDGSWILSMSGDHSRAFFLKPDLTKMNDVEGLLLNTQQFMRKREFSDEIPIDLCLGFLDGDIVFYSVEQNGVYRVHSDSIIKSLSCNGKDNMIAAHVEEKSGSMPYDTVKTGLIESSKEGVTIKWEDQIPLQNQIRSTIPLYINKELLAFILPDQENFFIYTAEPDGTISGRFALQSVNQKLDDWRVLQSESGSAVFWSSDELAIVHKGAVVFHKNGNFTRVSAQGHYLYIQSGSQVESFYLESF